MSTHADMLRRMYRGPRPSRVARTMNHLQAVLAARGIGPQRVVTLEVPGRRSGRTQSLPLVVADLDGTRYLVSMLGQRAGWVANVRAADGMAVLRHGRSERVRLVEVPAAQRPAILRRYLDLAPGGRPHIPVDRHAPDADFEAIAADFPVFRIDAA